MATIDQTAHNWAHKTGKAKNAHRVYYYDNPHLGYIIYSYGSHFPVARHVVTPDKSNVILFTTQSWSSATGGHKNRIGRAIPGNIKTFYVNDVLADSKDDHKENYKELVSQRNEKLLKASRARSNKEWHLRSSEDYRVRANDYTKSFRLGYREIAKPENFDTILNAAKEKAKIARIKQNKKNAKAKAVQKIRQAQYEKEAKERLEKWVNGEDVRPPSTTTPHVRIYHDMVQTSWGVNLPLKRALAVFRMAACCKKRGLHYKPKKRIEIAGWPLDYITKDGTVRAGCHVISFDAMYKAASIANLV